jgi:hypothetical protein
VFDYPTTAAVTSYLTERLVPEQEEASGAQQVARHLAPAPLAGAGAAVAIVAALARPYACPAGAAAAALGMGGIPLGDAVTAVPLSRWDRRQQAASPAAAGGPLPPQFGAFMADVDQFDAPAFGLSAGEAAAMDPQHRLLLEAAGELLAGPGQRLAALGALSNGGSAPCWDLASPWLPGCLRARHRPMRPPRALPAGLAGWGSPTWAGLPPPTCRANPPWPRRRRVPGHLLGRVPPAGPPARRRHQHLQRAGRSAQRRWAPLLALARDAARPCPLP